MNGQSSYMYIGYDLKHPWRIEGILSHARVLLLDSEVIDEENEQKYLGFF